MSKWSNRKVEETVAEAVDAERDHGRNELRGFLSFLSSAVALMPEPWRLSRWSDRANEVKLELKRRLAVLEIGPQLSQLTWGIGSPSIEKDFSVEKDFWNSVWEHTGPCPKDAVSIFANEAFWQHFRGHCESRSVLLRWWTKLEVNLAHRSFHVHDANTFISALEIFTDLGGEQYAAMPMAYVWQFLRNVETYEKRDWYKRAMKSCGLLFFVRSEVTGELCQILFRGMTDKDACILQAHLIGNNLRYGDIGIVSPERF